jgi:glycosyltransferase involved in cell wall biosynthesis
MVSLKELSVFFPAYNEEENVEKMCSSLKKILPQVAEDFEIIIVNDGSKDRTKEIADRLAQEDDHIWTVHHEKNLGYGAAVQSGIKACRKEVLFFTDGDGQFDVSQLSQFVPHISNHDGVIGYRLIRRDPLIRKLNAWAWNRLVRLLFGLKVRDIDCAFKVFHRKVFEGMQLESSGNMISAEMLIKIKARGCRLQERGVVHSPRLAGRQTGADLRVILKAFKELFHFYVKFKEANKWFLHPTETERMRI